MLKKVTKVSIVSEKIVGVMRKKDVLRGLINYEFAVVVVMTYCKRKKSLLHTNIQELDDRIGILTVRPLKNTARSRRIKRGTMCRRIKKMCVISRNVQNIDKFFKNE